MTDAARARARGAGRAAAAGSSAAPCATSCWGGRPPPTSTSSSQGHVEPFARALARAAARRGASRSRTSSARGAWSPATTPGRPTSRRCTAATIEADLRLRDFTVNAIARPLAGGGLVDPLGGAGDLQARSAAARQRRAALEDDPLRALRLVRLACELGLAPDAGARDGARAAAPALARVAGERVYAELRRVLASDRAAEGMRLALELGLCATVLPELEALRGTSSRAATTTSTCSTTRSRCSTAAVELERDPAAAFGAEHAPAIAAAPRRAARRRDDARRRRCASARCCTTSPSRRRATVDGRRARRLPRPRRAAASRWRAGSSGRLRAAERVRAHVGGADAQPPAARLPRSRGAAAARARCYRYLDGAPASRPT